MLLRGAGAVNVAANIAAASTTTETACAHCGLPVPPAFVEGPEPWFCCQGCRAVYRAIHECGLSRYYEIAQAEGPAEPAQPSAAGYDAWDDPAFQTSCVTDLPDGRRAIELYLQGVHCTACVWLVERLPRVVPGVIEARLDFRRQVARVTWDPQRANLSRIAGRLDSLGYPPHPDRGAARQEMRRRENRRHLVRIGVAGACAGNVMLIAFALYGGMMSGMDPKLHALFRGASLLLTLIALAWPGRTFFVGAISSIRTRVLHMDVPVAIALAAGCAWGAVNTFRGTGEVYFESLTAVVFLLLVGRWLQDRHRRSALDAVELLFSLTPAIARRLDDDGTPEDVPVERLEIGDRVEVRAGDTTPVDGVVLEGRSVFDRSVLTGESLPVVLAPGDGVHAGVTNMGSAVVVEVRATGAETRVGRLMAMVERFARDRPPIIRLADRVAHWFVGIVLALAAFTAVLWWRLDPELAVEHAIALLIVTCPCALGMATPLAVVAGIGRAAQAGMLIKGGETIERLATPGLVLLDKTGTITRGRVRVVTWEGDDDVRPLVAAIEVGVAHPVAAALVEAAEGRAIPEATDAKHLGDGARGLVEGRAVAVGSTRFVERHGIETPPWARDAIRACLDEGHSPVLASVDGRVRVVAGLGDPVHPDAREAIERLRRLGCSVGVVSGDHPEIVDAVARRVGIDDGACEGGASPERKAEIVRANQRRGERVIMVGDGVNDAAALSIANVGIAVHGGAEVALASSDAFVRHPGLGPVVDLLHGSRLVARVIRRNLAVSLGYNVVTASLAMAGLINPLVAAVLMPISSLTVVVLSYRSRTFDRRGTKEESSCR
ncbi:MAG: heavy metal translocating P-type ATPase [Planctomycetes bacterium]|nr:heavy metal translocating P-type ATPase [Planctomycetota bacterium]